VVSLGVQACLIPVDPEREREVARLLVRYNRVRQDWGCLTQETLQLLGRHQLGSAGAKLEHAPDQAAHVKDARVCSEGVRAQRGYHRDKMVDNMPVLYGKGSEPWP
jgi:hypothetical protein